MLGDPLALFRIPPIAENLAHIRSFEPIVCRSSSTIVNLENAISSAENHRDARSTLLANAIFISPATPCQLLIKHHDTSDIDIARA